MMRNQIIVRYICDQKACLNCSAKKDICKHTTDINHSINYKGTTGPTIDDLGNSDKFTFSGSIIMDEKKTCLSLCFSEKNANETDS